MKVIDLLNKIANGEEVPKNIKLFGVTFDYIQENETYLSHYGKVNLLDMNDHLLRNKNIKLLNEEIEIIEDKSKKIEKLEKPTQDEYLYSNGKELYENDMKVYDKVNELIDYINNKEEKNV